jgi:hypothetical protein
MQSKQLVETIRIHSWGTNAIQGIYARGPGQLSFRGSLCKLTLTAVLPEKSIDKYGAYLHLQGGPMIAGAGSGYAVDMVDHRRETMTLACTILPGSKTRSCTVELVPPKGSTLDQRFIGNSLYVDFFTIDEERIDQLTTMKQLTPKNRMYVDLVHQWKRCTPEELKPETTTSTPAATATTPPSKPSSSNKNNIDAGKMLVHDRVVFGPTEFSITDLPDKDHYFIVDYRTYFFEAVTGIDFQVVVGKTISNNDTSTSKKKTPVTVFFAKEPKDFYLGLDCDFDPKDSSGSSCIPPTDLRLKGTKVCEGYDCKGSLRGLDPKKQYFLWVSYPRYIDPSNSKLQYSKKKLKSEYTTELVTVTVFANDWKLGRVNTETISDGFRDISS